MAKSMWETRGYKAGEALGIAIAQMTDLFYQVDTRDRFMTGLISSLAGEKKKMDTDREKRRKK
jgi:hypothetical protein